MKRDMQQAEELFSVFEKWATLIGQGNGNRIEGWNSELVFYATDEGVMLREASFDLSFWTVSDAITGIRAAIEFAKVNPDPKTFNWESRLEGHVHTAIRAENEERLRGA